jgi:predicted component of type VI protein secretion system
MPEAMILKMLRGKDAGGLVTEVTIPATGAVLGRGLDCDIIFNEPTLSRKHCRFVFENGNWGVRDLGSRSGVIINGQEVNSSLLKQGDEITLGRLCLKVLSLAVPQVASSPDTLRFKCTCGKVHILKAALAGKNVVCKQCRAKFRVPMATAPETGGSVPEGMRREEVGLS